MADVGLKKLLQAGVHFGHQTSRWNPKMRKFIFAERGGIYLLDLKKTLRQLDRAREMIRETVEGGKNVLFVCTKPQLADIVRKEAERCGAFHVTERWVGGLLTNFQTIKTNIRRLKELEQGLEEGHFDYYTKKEQILLDRERQKLERYLSGIKQMTRLPGLVFVVDAKREEIAVKEADRLDIPLVAIADTNADPDPLDVPIPGNDDAIRSVSLITRAIADAVLQAREQMPETGPAAEQEEVYTYSSDAGETGTGGEGESQERRRKRPRRRPKPEVIAQARKEAGAEEAEAVEAAAEEAEALEEAAETPAAGGGAEETAEPAGEASAAGGEPDAATREAAAEDSGDAADEDEEEAVAVSAGAGGEEEDEEEPEGS